MDREAWQATVHGAAKAETAEHTHTHTHTHSHKSRAAAALWSSLAPTPCWAPAGHHWDMLSLVPESPLSWEFTCLPSSRWSSYPIPQGFRLQYFHYHFIFLSSKITAEVDCSHEIKRHLLLGRKVMTNLDSIVKRRDITLPTEVRLVKAMVFPVVMYGCRNWTVKKAESQELMLLNCGVGEDSWKSLGLQGDPTSPS